MNSPDKTTFCIKTFGCKVNQYESQLIRENLMRSGYTETEENRAHHCIINSCTVTHQADAETRNAVRHIHRASPCSNIIVTGCYAQTEEDRRVLSTLPGTVTIVKNSDKQKISELLSKSRGKVTQQKITEFKNHDRAFVKVQDGCNHNCSYCKIPIARGRSVSRPAGEVIDEIEGLAANGHREIVISGICLGAWGLDFPHKNNLTTLLHKIDEIQDEFRIRLSSIEPLYVTRELVDLMAGSKKICRHLHIPLQSGDNRILKRMQRPYNTKEYSSLIKSVRKKIPDIAITTDIMVGFPGESKKEFNNTYKFIKKVRPSRIHIFTYSPRKGTAASIFSDAPDPRVTRGRYQKLQKLAKLFSKKFAALSVGETIQALIEGKRDKNTGLLTGYTDTYIKILVKGSDSLKGNLVSLKNVPPDVITTLN